MGRADAPCKKCSDRTIGCHGLCKDYNNWAVANRKETEQADKFNKSTPILSTSSFVGVARHRGKGKK